MAREALLTELELTRHSTIRMELQSIKKAAKCMLLSGKESLSERFLPMVHICNIYAYSLFNTFSGNVTTLAKFDYSCAGICFHPLQNCLFVCGDNKRIVKHDLHTGKSSCRKNNLFNLLRYCVIFYWKWPARGQRWKRKRSPIQPHSWYNSWIKWIFVSTWQWRQ